MFLLHTATLITLNNTEAIQKAADVANGVTIVYSKQRPQIMDEVEKLLFISIKRK